MTFSSDSNPAPLFPENILTDNQNGKPWRVAHTKSRREKALAQYLAQADISYYLPMFNKRQASQARTRFSLMPVFSSYLFFKADDFERHQALRSNHIARIIDVGDQKRLIFDLLQVQKALKKGSAIYPYDFIGEGQLVRVIKGPMKDLEGVIIRKSRNCRLVISVKSIMQSISIEIDADHVAPIE